MGKPNDGKEGALTEGRDDQALDDHHDFGGVWTRIKLEALEKYLGAFNQG